MERILSFFLGEKKPLLIKKFAQQIVCNWILLLNTSILHILKTKATDTFSVNYAIIYETFGDDSPYANFELIYNYRVKS